MNLFIDTETTGIILPSHKLGEPGFPRLVQVSALLEFDKEAPDEDCFLIDTIILPDGFDIPDGAARVHGITTERAKLDGRILAGVLDELLDFGQRADADKRGRLIAHNLSFDYRILLNELITAKREHAVFGLLAPTCTMRALTGPMNLPGKFPGKPKWPRMAEAYRWMFGRDFDNAHSAKADMLACREVFYEGRKRGLWK